MNPKKPEDLGKALAKARRASRKGPERDYATICDRMGDMAENEPERIERIGLKLIAAWARVPYLRLGQFMVAITGVSDPFYEADSALEQRLDEFLATGKLPVQGG